MTAVPDISKFRRAVDQIRHNRDRILIEATYLSASRVSEMVTKVTPYDLKHGQTKPYGQHLTWSINEFQGEKALVLKIAVAKRKKKVRKRLTGEPGKLVFKSIALPCSSKFEPWTLDLLEYIKEHGNLNFPLVRDSVRKIVKKRLNLEGPIYTHLLRHFRLTHLVEYYGFDPYDLTIYSGWTFKTTFQASGQLDTYLHLDWRRYFPKLLKPLQI